MSSLPNHRKVADSSSDDVFDEEVPSGVRPRLQSSFEMTESGATNIELDDGSKLEFLKERARLESIVRQRRDIAMYGLVSEDHPLYQKVQELFQSLKIPEEKRCKIHLLKNSLSINARAYIDGCVFIDVGSFLKLPAYEEVWQALLAHEQTHFTECHHTRAIEKHGRREEKGLLEEVGSSMALTRISETEADVKGSILLLEQSGVNPLGAKVLMQALTETNKSGFHNAGHGSALDRVLNTESIFGLYDLKSLTGVMKPVGLYDLQNDPALQRESNVNLFGPLSQAEKLAKIEKMNLEAVMSWREEFIFSLSRSAHSGIFDRDEKIREEKKERLAVCNRRISEYIDSHFADFKLEERKGLEELFLYLYGDRPQPDYQCPLDQLEPLLSSAVWSRFPKHIIGNHLLRLMRLVASGIASEELDADTSVEHWSSVLASHFSFFEAEYPVQILRSALSEKAADAVALKKASEVPKEMVVPFEVMTRLFDEYKVEMMRKVEGTLNPDHKISQVYADQFDSFAAGMSGAQLFDFFQRYSAYFEQNRAFDLGELVDREFAGKPLTDSENERIDLSDCHSVILDFLFKRLLEVNLTKGCTPEMSAAKAIAIQSLLFSPEAAKQENNEMEDMMIMKRERDRLKISRNRSIDGQFAAINISSKGYHKALFSLEFGECVTESCDTMLLEKTNLLLSRINVQTEIEEVLDLLGYLFNPDGFDREVGISQSEVKRMNYYLFAAKKIICHYLSIVSADKERLKSVWHRFSEAGYVPRVLDRPQFSTYLNIFQTLALKLKWNLDDPSDCRFLLEFSDLMADTDQRSRLRTIVVDSYLRTCSNKEKIDHLFGGSSGWIRDLKLQREFIETEVTSHEQIRLVRSRIEETLRQTADDPSAKMGYVAVLDQFSTSSSSEILEMLLKTRDGDRELKDKLFDAVYYVLEVARLTDIADDESPVASRSLREACVHQAETALNQLFNASLGVRYALARHLLVKGKNGVLFSPKTKRRLFANLLEGVLSAKGNQVEVRIVIREVLDAIADVPDWEELYFAIAPVVADNILLSPAQRTPWEDMYCIEEKFDTPYKPSKRKKSVVAGEYAVDPVFPKRALSDQTELFLCGQKGFTQKRERMSPIQLVVKVAQHLGAPAVRFLQVLGQYVNIPAQYEEQFLQVYDAVQGQNKLLADVLLEREYSTYREDVEGLNFTAGGGSIMTVFGTSAEGKGGDVLKVRNPNVLYRMELAFGFIQKIINKLIEKDPAKYTVLQDAFQDIADWIRHDIKDEDFLQKDTEFRAKHDGYTYEGSAYRVRVPRTKGPDSEYFKREEYAPGLNLTAWNELAKSGHDMKDVISLMTKNYLSQLSKPVNNEGVIRLHADVHPGNFRVDSENNLWILDRNGYLDYEAKDMEFFSNLMSSGTQHEMTDAVVTYFSDQRNEPKVRSVVEACFKTEADFDFAVLQKMMSDLRRANVQIPLKITLLLKNLNTLNRFALKAGFKGGFVEALGYQPGQNVL